MPKALEHFQHSLDSLVNIPLSLQKQCWFMEDIHATHKSNHLQVTLMDVSI